MGQAFRVKKVGEQLQGNTIPHGQHSLTSVAGGARASSFSEVDSRGGGAFRPLSSPPFSMLHPAADFNVGGARARPSMARLRNPDPLMKVHKPESESAEVLRDDLPIPWPQLPCCGLVANPRRELLVVGTAHTPCQSAAEVTAIIERSRPDVVVIELDQERLEALLEDNEPAVFSTRPLGEDFKAAFTAATSVGAYIVLGDAKARDTFGSLRTVGPIVDGKRIARGLHLATSRLRRSSSDALRIQPVSEVASLLDDPGKLIPLLAVSWWTFFLDAAVWDGRDGARIHERGDGRDVVGCSCPNYRICSVCSLLRRAVAEP